MGAGGVPPKDFVESRGVNGGSPTSFDLPPNELEAARPQVSYARLLYKQDYLSIINVGEWFFGFTLGPTPS